MIRLQELDLSCGRADLVDVPDDLLWAAEARVFESARALGLHQLRLHNQSGEVQTHRLIANPARMATVTPTPTPTDDGVATDCPPRTQSCLLSHRCVTSGSDLEYDALFAHESASLPLLSAYLGFLLTTHGLRRKHLMQLRLAVYEICANVIEHGVPLGDVGQLHLHLGFRQDFIDGWVQDNCLEFDTARPRSGDLREFADQRQERGYGLRMLPELLDSLEHDYNGAGNRSTFRKRISQ